MDNVGKQPKSLKILLIAEFTERFSFWGLQSLLVLYLTRIIKLPLQAAYLTYGTCSAFTFGLSILGGILADRLLGFRRALTVGVLLAIIGNIVLIIPKTSTLYLGLALIICGTALFVPNNSNLLGTFYEQNDLRRNKGFYLLYMGTNLGGLLGPIIYGIIAVQYGWHYSFIFSTVILGLWLFWFSTQKEQFQNHGKPPAYPLHNNYLTVLRKYSILFSCFSMIFILLITWILIQNPSFTSSFLMAIGLATLIGLTVSLLKQKRKKRRTVFSLLSMMLVCLLFFSIEFQVNSSLILFSDQYVNRYLFNWQVPSSAFAALEPMFIILLAPLLGFFLPRLGKHMPSAGIMLISCLLLESASFYIFYLGGHITGANQKIPFAWMLSGNLLLGAGEVFLMPTLISSITQLAPKHLKGTLMGTLYLVIAFSSYAAGLIAAMTTKKSVLNKILFFDEYLHVYLNISRITFGIAVSGILIYIPIKFRREIKSFLLNHRNEGFKTF